MKEYKVVEVCIVNYTLELPKGTSATKSSICTKASNTIAAFLRDIKVSYKQEGNVLIFTDDSVKITYERGLYKLLIVTQGFAIEEILYTVLKPVSNMRFDFSYKSVVRENSTLIFENIN